MSWALTVPRIKESRDKIVYEFHLKGVQMLRVWKACSKWVYTWVTGSLQVCLSKSGNTTGRLRRFSSSVWKTRKSHFKYYAERSFTKCSHTHIELKVWAQRWLRFLRAGSAVTDLCKVLLSNSLGPDFAEMSGATGIGDVGTLDQHLLHDHSVLAVVLFAHNVCQTHIRTSLTIHLNKQTNKQTMNIA